jgi:hypothetical protein
LGENELSLYLREDGMNYWDKTIVIGKKERHWGTTRVLHFPNSGNLLKEMLLA